MKRKILITLLLSLILTVMSISVLAVEAVENDMYSTMLISEDLEMIPEYDVMPIVDDTIKVQLDGVYVDFTDEQGNVVNPEIINNRTMVPMRKIFEIFNAQVNWNNETRTVVATTEDKEITLTINNDKAKVKNLVSEEEKEITLDSVPVILNNRTMVPVRFIAESLEKEVGWDSDVRTVVIIDFEKLLKELEEKAPMLKEIFEIEIDPVDSFKTESEIQGIIIYKDVEDKAKNETVEIDGSLEMNMNKEKAIEMSLELDFKGDGAIYDSLKENGYKEVKYGMVMVDEEQYMMMMQDDEEVWTKLESQVDMNSLSTMQMTNMPKSYEEYIESLKTTFGEIDSTTYFEIKQMIVIISSIYSEDNVKITGNDDKKTIKIELDIVEFLGTLSPTVFEEVEDLKLKLYMTEKIKNKKVDTAEIVLEMVMEEPTTKEKMEIDFEIDMEYKSINKDFEIKKPVVVAE